MKAHPAVSEVWGKCEAFAHHVITAREFYAWLQTEHIMNYIDLRQGGGWDFILNICLGS